MQAVVELDSRHGGSRARPLLHHIYRSSAHGDVALVLNGIGWQAIDRMVDEVIHQLPLTIPGLRYFALTDAGLPQAVGGARLIFVSTRLFRTWLDRQGADRHAILPIGKVRSRLPCAGPAAARSTHAGAAHV